MMETKNRSLQSELDRIQRAKQTDTLRYQQRISSLKKKQKLKVQELQVHSLSLSVPVSVSFLCPTQNELDASNQKMEEMMNLRNETKEIQREKKLKADGYEQQLSRLKAENASLRSNHDAVAKEAETENGKLQVLCILILIKTINL